MGTVLVVVLAFGAVGAFLAGAGLLIMYFRAGRGNDYYEDEPVVYGNLVQCPNCGYMNPLDAAACLNCRYAFHHAQSYQQPSNYAYSMPTPPPQNYSYPPPPVSAHTLQAPAAGATVRHPPPAAPVAKPASSNGSKPGEMPRAWLEGTAGPFAGERADLSQADTLVGRSTQCDVQIFDPKVSRRHFKIRYANGDFFLQDQESSRGTRINGERVPAQKLYNGDRIELGDTSLIFHVE